MPPGPSGDVEGGPTCGQQQAFRGPPSSGPCSAEDAALLLSLLSKPAPGAGGWRSAPPVDALVAAALARLAHCARQHGAHEATRAKALELLALARYAAKARTALAAGGGACGAGGGLRVGAGAEAAAP